MKLVLISDTHCRLEDVTIPEGDLLIHAGDLTFQGSIQEVSKEAQQLAAIRHRFTHGIIFVPGNHDWGFERNEGLFRDIMDTTRVLINEAVTIDGHNFYGSPVSPSFCNWAFNVDRGPEIAQVWDRIPADTNVLITHGPPYGSRDACPDGARVGCVDLAERIKSLPDLRLHVFGHIHHSYGTRLEGNVHYINASICTEKYKPTNQPIIINI